jgi:hypothetical protein
MAARTLVFIVCSPHARAGVTTTARLLTDFFLSQGSPVEGFDTDPHEPRYATLFPDIVRTIDIADIKGQISLFDRLLVHDETPKIVDVWHRSFDRFFSTVREIGFFEEARRKGVEPIIVYQVDGTAFALAKAMALSASWKDLWMISVQNEGAAPLDEAPPDLLLRYPARGKFVIPPLDAPIARRLDNDDISLAGFLVSPPPNMSIVVRAALKSWLQQIFTQFQSFELRLNLESSDYLR